MSTFLEDSTRLRAPAFSVLSAGRNLLALDPAKPHWIASEKRGLYLLGQCDGRTPFATIVRDYASHFDVGLAEAWLQAETFCHDALRAGFLSTDGASPAPYLGREAYLRLEYLSELWIQVNDFCNLSCQHCLVSSGPDREQGLKTDRLIDAIDQAVALGTKRIFFTGGEPLARPDILELVQHVLKVHQLELVVLTNGTLLKGDLLSGLSEFAAPLSTSKEQPEISSELRIQVSLDGSNPEINDPIRGQGSFRAVCKGIQAAVEVGLRPTLTTTILKQNLNDIDELIRLASTLGLRNFHLLWPHRRGRLLDGLSDDVPHPDEILRVVRKAQQCALELNVIIDNIEEFRLRLDGSPGVKNDLAGSGWNSLCLYTDGCIYPSASLAGVSELQCGDLTKQTLSEIWKQSEVCKELREATVEKKTQCRSCSIRFLCGGGDVEHGYWASSTEPEGSGRRFLSHDPYCDLYQGLAKDALEDMAEEGRQTVQQKSGFDRPVVFRSMGEQTLHDDISIVRTTHSACVLSEEVLEKSRLTVRDFYGDAAEEPKVELCCPVTPDPDDLAHIPKEVVERFYGCGSPVAAAMLVPGEIMVDLGSGAGIDCFVAAKKVGQSGRVYGIDMTEQMLAVARKCQGQVAGVLGYDAVEFRHGYLEEIPLEDAVANVVTSNCVINLSADKPRVLREVWRVLKDHGRAVVSDIVSDRDVPPKMRADGKLWGECISGALTEQAFLSALERAGFYGVSILSKTPWRIVEGCQFFSVTVRGYKFEKKAGCKFVGQYAVYRGPQKAVVDEEGHLFPRGIPVEICTDTAAKLSQKPYADSFVISNNPTAAGFDQEDDNGCEPGCC